jgi:hypothetical protein
MCKTFQPNGTKLVRDGPWGEKEIQICTNEVAILARLGLRASDIWSSLHFSL